MSRHPRLGGLILSVTDDPQSTKAWARGAAGERRLGACLDVLADEGVVVLHDRRIPQSRANIDHIVVARSGVWVIDAKNYRGQIAKRDTGGWFRSNQRLFVGRRDCTTLATGMAKQVTAVANALGEHEKAIPIHSALCFINAEWRLFAKPFTIDGVIVTWAKALVGLIRETEAAGFDVAPTGVALNRALTPAS